jgi:hemolysin activation/secretion protein
VLGKGKIADAQLIFPLVNDANATHSLTFSAAYKDFNEFVRLSDDSLATPISYLGFTLGENSVWRVPQGEWGLVSSVNFAVRPLVNDETEFANKRFKARSNYFYVRADGSYRHAFGSWIETRVRAGGQYAVEPVISNEQFAVGGASSVRGYLEAEELGDIGIAGSFEFGLQPQRLVGGRLIAESFLFFDAGIATSIAPLPGEDRRVDLSSTGLGLNLNFDDHYAASVSWAYPLVPAGRTAAGDSRFLFMMRSSW